MKSTIFFALFARAVSGQDIINNESTASAMQEIVDSVVTAPVVAHRELQRECRLCPGTGHEPAYDRRHIPLLKLPGDPSNAPMCGHLVDFLKDTGGDLSEEKCEEMQEAYAGYCGCTNSKYKNPPQNCPLCPNGDEPEEQGWVGTEGLTCKDLYHFANYLPQNLCDSNDSKQVHQHAAECGCAKKNPLDDLLNDVAKANNGSGSSGGAQSNGSGSSGASKSDPRPPAATPTSQNSKAQTQPNASGGPNAAILAVAIVIPVVLALLVLGYYFCYARKNETDKKEMVKEAEKDAENPEMEDTFTGDDVPVVVDDRNIT